MKDKNNFTSKSITEFNENDTVYLVKNNSGFTYTFLLKFKSFSKGKIVGKIIEIQPNDIKSIWIGKNLYKIGGEISGSFSKCYTFKKETGCRWFKKEVGIISCF